MSASCFPTHKLVGARDGTHRVGVPYRTETSSLVYASREIREVLLALAAVADPTDELATVAALRSFVYGCGDDDLAHWRLGVRGRFTCEHRFPRDRSPTGRPRSAASPAAPRGASWSTPAELLDRLIRERVCSDRDRGGNPRDVWRRLRFVIDQARAWVDAGGVDLRAYLRWARLQGADNARVSETVLPETDDDSVRIMTIHGSKGLEFPITVLAGMTTKIQKSDRGTSISFPPDSDPVLRLSSAVTSEGYSTWKSIDEQMDEHERLRLLYVAATRARDHLIVSLHRTESTRPRSVGHGRTRHRVSGVHAVRPDDRHARHPPARTGGDSRSRHLADRTQRRARTGERTDGRRRHHPRPGGSRGCGSRSRQAAARSGSAAVAEGSLRHGGRAGVHGVLQVIGLADGAGLTAARPPKPQPRGWPTART